MRRFALLAFLPLVLALSGCFQVFSTLTVRSDGSAQIVERVTAEGAMAMGLMAMDERLGGASSFEARAAGLGEGVELVSVEEEVVPGSITYVVTYHVPNVNTLVYSVSDAVDPDAVGESVMGGGMGMEDPSMEGAAPCDPDVEDCDDTRTEDPSMEGEITMAEDSEPPYRFAFTPASGGQPAALQVIVPEGAGGPADLDLSEMGSGMETEEDSYKQALVLLGTMSMHFQVKVEGELVGADRGWTEDNTVTLSSVQMGDLLTYARDEIIGGDVEEFIARQDPTVDVDIPGLRYVAPGTVTVQFR